MADACIFCKIVAGGGPATNVDEDEHPLAFMDRAPGTRGHALVIPKEHHEDLWTIDPEALAHTMRAAQRLALKARDNLGADGMNLINSCRPAAWQTVFHFHVHVVPRYEGDPLRLPWTPEEGDQDEIKRIGQQLGG